MNENTNVVSAEVIPPEQTKAVEIRESHPLSVGDMKTGLDSIRAVMAKCMTEGQDYGKVPGCGNKPGLFQPGAQKLSMMFQLSPEVKSEVITDYEGHHRGYRFVIRVSNGSKFAEGVGECSTLETKYKSRPAPDQWNTVRKMAYKRGFVHAIINATNTSELWSQDLEDLAANGVITAEPVVNRPPAQDQSKRVSSQNDGPMDWRDVRIHFGKNKDVKLGDLSDKSLRWYFNNFTVSESYTANDGSVRQCTPDNISIQEELRDALDAAGEELHLELEAE